MIENPSVVAFAGDWHMNLPWARSMVNHCAELGVEAIVHTGDFGFTFDKKFMLGLNNALVKTGIQLYFVDGNHENHEWLATQPFNDDGTKRMQPYATNIHYLPRGFTWNWWGKVWMGLGGAVSVDQDNRIEGTSWWRTEEITYGQAYEIMDTNPVGSVDIMVTHDVPDRVSWPGSHHGRDYFPGNRIDQSEAHARLLGMVVDHLAPSLLVHGHMHVRYSQWRLNSDKKLGSTLVTGLDCDGSREGKNLMVVDAEMVQTVVNTAEARK